MVIIGIGLRLQQWLHARSLWLDEAMISLNVLGRGYGELTTPLDSDQTAPVPFLWAVKLATNLFGSQEQILRLPALLTGLVVLLLVMRLGRRILDPWAAALAVGVTALSPALVYYANEVKPYGVDAALAAGLAWLTLRLLDRPASPSRWAALLSLGLATVLSSTPAPFVLASVSLALIADPAIRSSRVTRSWLTACLVTWFGSFVLVYLTVYRTAADNQYLHRFWLDFFLDPSSPGFPSKLTTALGLFFRDLLLGADGGWRQRAALLSLVPLIGGAVVIARRRLPLACLLGGPLLAGLAASALNLYPAAPRLLLYCGPAVIILAVAGLARLAEAFGPRWRPALFTLAGAAILILPAREALRQARFPFEREAIRPLVARFLRDHTPGAAAYVPGRTIPAWLYYTTDWDAPDLERVRRLAAAVNSKGPLFYQRATRGAAVSNEGDAFRFWHRDWQEMIGVPPGRGPDTAGRRRVGADSGWVQNELRRLTDSQAREAWLIVTTYQVTESDPLGRALVAAGARETVRETTAGGFAARFDLSALAVSPAEAAASQPRSGKR